MDQLSHPYMITGKTIALTIQTFVSKEPDDLDSNANFTNSYLCDLGQAYHLSCLSFLILRLWKIMSILSVGICCMCLLSKEEEKIHASVYDLVNIKNEVMYPGQL